MSQYLDHEALVVTEPEPSFAQRYLYTRRLDYGRGLFTKKGIRKGDRALSLAFDTPDLGQLITEQESYEQKCDEYGLWLSRAFYCPSETNPFRYVNHSCDPNVAIRNYGLPIYRTPRGWEIILQAQQAISPHDQLTLDYSALTGHGEGNLNRDEWQLDHCKCGAEGCRGRIRCFHELPLAQKWQHFIGGSVLAHVLEVEWVENPEFLYRCKNDHPDKVQRVLEAAGQLATISSIGSDLDAVSLR